MEAYEEQINQYKGKRESVIANTVTNLKPSSPNNEGHKLIARPCRSPEIFKVKTGFRLHFIPDRLDLNVDYLIKQKVDDDLKCFICADLLKEPLSCSKCHSEYCKECIKDEIKKHSKCPKCFNIIFFELLQPPSENINDKYETTFLKCPYKGCLDEINLKEFKHHAEVCPFQNVKDEKDFSKLICDNDKHDLMEDNKLVEYFKKLYIMEDLIVKSDSLVGESKLNSKFSKSKTTLPDNIQIKPKQSFIKLNKRVTKMIKDDNEIPCLRELSKYIF